VRLRVYSRQYTEGLLSLTEYQKKNLVTIKKIVHSQSVGLRSGSDTDLKSPGTPANMSIVSQLLSQPDDQSEFEPPLRMRSHSSEIIQALATSASISSCYPQSFRFVLFIDNSLMLFTPHTDTTAVVVVRGNAKMLKKAYSQMREQEEVPQRPLEASAVPRTDSSEFEFVNPQLASEEPLPVKDAKQRRPSIVSRRHSSADVQTPRAGVVGAKQNPGFKTLPLRKPLVPPSRPPIPCLTPPQVDPPFTSPAHNSQTSLALPTDGRLISALSDLPLASEDMFLDGVAFGSMSSKDDESMIHLLRRLGYQNIVFVWTALMLEEVVPLLTHSLSPLLLYS
jgi:hypothetical protein